MKSRLVNECVAVVILLGLSAGLSAALWPPGQVEKSTGKAVTGSSIWRHPKMEVVDVPKPKIKPDEVLLKVKYCGVCGSDIHFYETDKDGYILYPGLTKFPTTTGH
ncbi:MAG: alcohol dehydrogenase catalytic domain-containing protein, partial [Acidobacteria bacterium]|nr:alcohol dehydrogenase catalytic domain-containing protein [Acidobacteriota bacterium]